ncbi:MAG: VOC family protein [Gammaproteobacteria bacterium]|nr:VOC family protein [Gammaproteobacteria bacterium]
MSELGHVVFYVRNLARSQQFYQNIVGLQKVAKLFNGKAVMLSGGRTHHELLLIEVGEAPGPAQGKRIGLYHVGWKLGDSLEQLRRAKQRIEREGGRIDAMADHGISHSLYLHDPDGNEVELYVDNPDCNWRQDSSWLQMPVRPLLLE